MCPTSSRAKRFSPPPVVLCLTALSPRCAHTYPVVLSCPVVLQEESKDLAGKLIDGLNRSVLLLMLKVRCVPYLIAI